MKFHPYLLAIISGLFAASIAVAEEPKSEKMLTTFTPEENTKMSWSIVNDGVMGGLSKGIITYTEAGTMKFHGDLSLENGGGFSSLRSKAIKLDLSGSTGLILKVKGDGRTYKARMNSDATIYGDNAVSFSGEFSTKAGEWVEVKIPFSSFKGSWRGQDLPDKKLNIADIRQVGIIIADYKQAPFSVEIDWVKAYTDTK